VREGLTKLTPIIFARSFASGPVLCRLITVGSIDLTRSAQISGCTQSFALSMSRLPSSLHSNLPVFSGYAQRVRAVYVAPCPQAPFITKLVVQIISSGATRG
jgi:hypothetical protein